jgi:cyclic pyranopterin phosphate synthase
MNVNYLRVSVTDRCNLRCIYCNPLGGGARDRQEILTIEEIRRVVAVSARCGIRTVRLTGGEPLVRPGIVDLVRELAAVPGIDDLALTTNGVLLGPMAAELKKAGLRRVNVSLDAADRECFQRMTGSDFLAHVLAGIDKAIEVGLTPVRINCVVVKDANLSQVPALAEMSTRLPISVRFIEYCPTARRTTLADGYVPNSGVRRIIESRFGVLENVVPCLRLRKHVPTDDCEHVYACVDMAPGIAGPAMYFRIAGAPGLIGFISGRSSVFCDHCNRLRLTSDGRIKPCLYSTHSYDLKTLLRNGADDQAVLKVIRQAMRDKTQYTRLTARDEDFVMQNIGG